MASANREKALAWLAAGHYVLPGIPGTKRPIVGYERESIEKVTKADVKRWWKETPDAEVLVVPGRASTPLHVLDIDWKPGQPDGRESIRDAGLDGDYDLGGGEPSRSGLGEHHWRLASPDYERNGTVSGVLPGVDTRSYNGLVAVTHYPAVVVPADVTEVAPSRVVSQYRPRTAADDLDLVRTLSEYAEPGKPSKRARRAGAAILADGQDRGEVQKPLRHLLGLVLEGEKGALGVYTEARERWSAHPEANVEADWDSLAREVITTALAIEEFDPGHLVTRKERKKAKKERKRLQAEAGHDPEAELEGLSADEARRNAEVRDQAERLAILADARAMFDAARRGEVPSFASRVVKPSELADRPKPPALVDGVLGQGQTAMLVADSNVGKSFLAIALSHAVATGAPWQGRETVHGRVLYVLGEDESGFPERLKASTVARGAIDDDMLDIVEAPFALNDAVTVAEVAALVAEREYSLVILDPLARFIEGMNENDASEMSVVVAALDRIRRAHPGATILVPHHTNKGGTFRGSTALFAAMDTVLGLVNEGGLRTLSLDKSKSSATGKVADLRLTAVPGTDSVILEGTTIQAAPVDLAPGLTDEVLQLFAALFEHTIVSWNGFLSEAVTHGLNRKTAGRGIKRLVDRGYLAYVNPSSKNLHLTDAGRHYIAKITYTDPLDPPSRKDLS